MAITFSGTKLTLARIRPILARHGWIVGPRENTCQYHCLVTHGQHTLVQYKTLGQLRHLAVRLILQEVYDLQLMSKCAIPPE
jgi:hypothetical protein